MMLARRGRLEIGDVLKGDGPELNDDGAREKVHEPHAPTACRSPERQLMSEDQTDRRAFPECLLLRSNLPIIM